MAKAIADLRSVWDCDSLELFVEIIMSIKSHKDLDVWKKGIDIVDMIYDLVTNFPKNELYGLVSQMQRAAVSIPSNIAEGAVKQHSKEFLQYLRVALGSCAELETQLIICNRRKFISDMELAKAQEAIDHESRMLMNLIKSIKAKS